ncbi:MAG: FtsK/SpoIIIE domain-containing protein, partial [Streptococcus sp.]|nr:FtsK/SpoIIIE domain-containing protein [Streptococcus sp.]
YWIGAYVINDAAATARLPLFSDMIVFMSYAMQVVMGFLLMGALFIVLPRTMVSAKRINQVLDLHSSIQNPAQVQLADENLKGQVEFKDVTFRYAANSEAVIEHVSFRAEAGQTVAFIGSTGSGKSVAVNGIIASILMKARPDQVKFMMIDPKMVELSVYNDIPHLLIPVVTNPRKAARALQKVVDEMENRYELFSHFGVRNIAGYNAKVEEFNAQSEQKQIPLPLIVVIVDELADLMMVASKEVEDAIIRLGQKARAAGIHMILATQRPSVDVISGLIKANVPSRVAFAVSSGTDSRTILDENGAEKLLGRGDMLFKPIDENHPVRLQGSFISDDDVERIVGFVKDQADADYDDSFDPGEVSESDLKSGGGAQEGDPLFEDAKALVLETQKASASMLQRRLSVGFNRATRLMDELEAAGVIGPAEGTKPRKVLMTNPNPEA